MTSGLRSKECKDTMNPWGLECSSTYVTWVYIRQIKEDDLSKQLELFFFKV